MDERIWEGSSPRVRGKLAPQGHLPEVPRLIPACAGKTPPPSLAGNNAGAHPRVCGENSVIWSQRLRASGSSPRVRGKHQRGRSLRHARGLIPACAGKTRADRADPHPHPAHPRVCGENEVGTKVTADLEGSSPRVRGKHVRHWRGLACAGLIPARAGKTRALPCTRPYGWAHPRACGENRAVSMRVDVRGGSSPRVRGKLRGVAGCGGVHGLIPARAGKTRLRILLTRSARAHPRACGENGHAEDPVGPRGCLIPARAGKTAHTGTPCTPNTAHPRACGENRNRIPTTTPSAGSSPRVRGKPSKLSSRVRRSRLIPARAGKTESLRAVVESAAAHPRACGENDQ